jgi:hypothetical protein
MYYSNNILPVLREMKQLLQGMGRFELDQVVKLNNLPGKDGMSKKQILALLKKKGVTLTTIKSVTSPTYYALEDELDPNADPNDESYYDNYEY